MLQKSFQERPHRADLFQNLVSLVDGYEITISVLTDASPEPSPEAISL